MTSIPGRRSRGHNLKQTSVRDLNLNRARDAAVARARAAAAALSGDLVHGVAVDLRGDLIRDLIRDVELAYDLSRKDDDELLSARDLARRVAVDLESGRAGGAVIILVRELARILERIDVLLSFEGASLAVDRIPERLPAVRVAPVADRLTAAAARVLPARDRARYAEELQSELWEIVRAGGDRRRQLAYAARQVMAAPRLRAGLRVPRRRGAMP